MPDGPKRVDAVLLLSGAVLIVEMKGDGNWQLEYREQAADYARRLLWFHRYCGEDGIRVHTILVNYGYGESAEERDFLTTTRIEHLAEIMKRFDRPEIGEPLPLDKFLSEDALQPSPSLVQAVHGYFSEHALPRIKRIDEVTKKTVQRIVTEIHDTHARRKRKLLLVSGVPGAQAERPLDYKLPTIDFSTTSRNQWHQERTSALRVSCGNGPLMKVLGSSFKVLVGESRTFVEALKRFFAKYRRKRCELRPFVFRSSLPKTQRPSQSRKSCAKHNDAEAVSEPEAFVSFAERVPGWCVVIGLIGTGQEIHAGEEGGMPLWAEAVANSDSEWEVIGPERFRSVFEAKGVSYVGTDDLHLGHSVRFHFAAGLSEWADGVVSERPTLLGWSASHKN